MSRGIGTIVLLTCAWFAAVVNTVAGIVCLRHGGWWTIPGLVWTTSGVVAALLLTIVPRIARLRR
jgi:hypothetical protein